MDRMLEKLPVICLSGWVLLVMGMGGRRFCVTHKCLLFSVALRSKLYI